ncbi:MAG: cytochrome b/b6 domain-containing protein [Acidimicrobiales bacterium]
MALTESPARTAVRVLRFDGVQRAAHWSNAALFGVLMFTAIPLYFGSFFGVVFPRHLIEQIHLWCGISLAAPLVISMLGPWGRGMRRDARRVNYWTRREINWLLSFGQRPLEADKFNPGQKLNALFVVAAIFIMLVTGSMLQWFRFFPVPWRTGATFVHDAFAYAIFAVVAGHVMMALTHPEALRSMFTGWVSEKWALRHAPAWLKERDADTLAP